MKAKRLTLKEFTAFKQVDIEFSPGLNVFIGANATGKSHMMKLIYSILKVQESRRASSKQHVPDTELQDKLSTVFVPDGFEIGRLVRRAQGRKRAQVRLQLDDSTAKLDLTTQGKLSLDWEGPPPAKQCIFIPSREALAMYDGFIAAYNKRELSFDETYYDLCVALSAKPLRGRRQGEIAERIAPLEEIIGGSVTLEGRRFHVSSKDGIIEAHLLAEGYRKIASLIHLIGNGSLTRNDVLLWDEPEANLNPKLITQIAEVLRHLAKGGIQVFVATHDYLLSHELSLAAEYKTEPAVPIRFFAFSRKNCGPVKVEAGRTLAELSQNPILEEFAAHYDRENELFWKTARESKEKTS